jgi:hypothetical protein
MHSGVNGTAVQIWHRCDFGPHIRVALSTFKGNIYKKNIHRQIDLHYIYNFDIDTAVTKIGDFIVDFLREFETIFKKTLICVSGA